MSEHSEKRRAIELLQELGLKEYEAKAFVALSRLPECTAKDISEHSEVPRTRVYDAVRVLETKGLVEVQHSNPQQFRAVSVDEAVGILRAEYEERTESLKQVLTTLEPESVEGDDTTTHEVWALSGTSAIVGRTEKLVEEADSEILIVLGDSELLTENLRAALAGASERGIDVLVGAVSEELRAVVADELPMAETFVTELSWLQAADLPGDTTDIRRLLLVDRSAILVSSQNRKTGSEEQAVYGRGFDNGIVAIVRRLMGTGLRQMAEGDD